MIPSKHHNSWSQSQVAARRGFGLLGLRLGFRRSFVSCLHRVCTSCFIRTYFDQECQCIGEYENFRNIMKSWGISVFAQIKMMIKTLRTLAALTSKNNCSSDFSIKNFHDLRSCSLEVFQASDTIPAPLIFFNTSSSSVIFPALLRNVSLASQMDLPSFFSWRSGIICLSFSYLNFLKPFSIFSAENLSQLAGRVISIIGILLEGFRASWCKVKYCTFSWLPVRANCRFYSVNVWFMGYWPIPPGYKEHGSFRWICKILIKSHTYPESCYALVKVSRTKA